MSTKVKVASLSDALNAGFVPKGHLLENPKTGVSIDQGIFRTYSGQVKNAVATGHAGFPYTIDGVIFPADLVYPKESDLEFKGGEFDVFADGSVQSIAGVIYERDFIEALNSAGKKPKK